MPTNGDADKYDMLAEALRRNDSSIHLGQELGVNWSAMHFKHKWRSQLQLHFDASSMRTYTSHNAQSMIKSQRQWGGTSVTSFGKISYYADGAGSDKAKLGRWTWARYRGRQQQHLRVVSVYRPCESQRLGLSVLTVYSQHKQFLQSQNDDRCPRKAFLQDLADEINDWKMKGDHILVAGDLNQHILGNEIKDFFASLNMRNAIFDIHSPEDCPATYRRNASGDIIDGIWCTENVHVTRCGYLEPGDFPGDHAVPWVDVTYESVLGHNPQTPSIPSARRLKLTDSKALMKYTKRYTKLIREYCLDKRQYLLEASTSPGIPLTAEQAKEAECIDELRTKCMLKAEYHCRKFRYGAIAFSKETSDAVKSIDFWRTAIFKRKGGVVNARLYERKKEAAQVLYVISDLSTTQMEQFLQEAKNSYRTAKKNHQESRIKFIETFSPKDRDRILRVEEQRRMGRASQRISGKSDDKSVRTVIVNGQEYDQKELIETAIQPVNEAKYRACEDTPFLLEPLVSVFGYNGHCPEIDAVLQGTYTPPLGTDPYAIKLLNAMKMPFQAAQSSLILSNTISTEEHIRAWSKAKERTSSGKSGLHFGLFKANAREEHLAALDASMRSVAYSTGFVYERWKTGVDVQILKRSRDYRIEKLRTILQLEADYNMNNKKFNREWMWKAERDHTISQQNYGNRKKLRAVEISMNQQLTYNSIWGKRGRAIIISNDAKGCFDRIAHVVAYICLLRLGASQTTLQGIILAIQDLKHYIRTAFGDSDTYYHSTPDRPPLQGLFQGNGVATTGWTAISTVLVEAMKAEGFGYESWTLISRKAISLVCFQYVDDTDLIVSNNDAEVQTDQLIYDTQEVLHTWEGLLRAAGGALAPDKSYWYLVEVFWRDNKWRYKTTDDEPGELLLHDTDVEGGYTAAQRLEVNVAKESLGIQIRPDGKMDDEVAYLKQKAEAWADAIRTKHPPPDEIMYSLRHCIMKTIEYPLMATTLTRKEVDSIMSPILFAALPRCGIQRRMPRKLVYGTLFSQGLDIPDPFVTQLIEHLHAILRHTTRTTTSTPLLQDNMELVQVYTGSETPFWNLSFSNYGCLVPTGWMKHTWEALSETNLTLQGGHLQVIPKKRQGDVYIMDALISSYHDHFLNQPLFEAVNNVRMYLQVTTLADITSADGTSILQSAWKVKPYPQYIDQHKYWPKSRPPSQVEIDRWRECIDDLFFDPETYTRQLFDPLGAWLSPHDDQWKWWYSPTTKEVWQQVQPCQWKKWIRRHTRETQHPSFICNHEAAQKTDDLMLTRASIAMGKNGTYLNLLSYDANQYPIDQHAFQTKSFSDSLEALPSDAHWAIRNLQMDDDGYAISEGLLAGRIIAVSDGSYKFGFGTSAYVIESSSSQHRILGVNAVPGPLSEGDSYRCELAGAYAVILIVDTLSKHYHLPRGKATFYCDNKATLRIFDIDYAPDPSQPSFDLVAALWNTLQNSNVIWRALHVKGHQDAVIPSDALTRQATLNIEMDELAKAYWRHLCQNTQELMPVPAYTHIHNEGWSIWDGNHKLAQPHRSRLYEAIQDPITVDWWVRHNRIHDDCVFEIDWNAAHDHMRHLRPYQRMQIVKSASHQCGVGTTLQKWEYQEDAQCPRCRHDEDPTHIILCHGEGADDVWSQQVEKIALYLESVDTCPEIQEALITCLHTWRCDRPCNFSTFSPGITAAITSQSRIGWMNLIEGLPGSHWMSLQEQYYHSLGSRKTSKRWMRGFLHALHLLWEAMWNHRNQVKHNLLQPRHKAEIKKLHQEIMHEMSIGPGTLPQGDRSYFSTNLATLLSRSLTFKQSWLIGVTTARQRHARKRQRDDELIVVSQKRSKLFQWIQTGRAS